MGGKPDRISGLDVRVDRLAGMRHRAAKALPRGPLRDWLACIAGNTRRLRRERGLTQMALAERASMSLRSIQRVEGATVDLSVGCLVILATALGVEPTDLLGKDALASTPSGRTVSRRT